MFRGIRRTSFFQRRQSCQPRGVYPSAPRYEMLGSDLRAFRQAGYFLRRDLPLGGKRRVAVSEEHFGTAPSEGELSYLWAHFSPETPFFEGESGAAYTLPEYGRAASQRIGVIFRQLVDCSRRNMYTTRMVECALEMLLTELTQEHLDSCGTGRESNPLIEDINEWIRLNCHRQITINDVAEEFHYNPEYLSSLYSRETGSTLTRSIVMARVDISKRMLSDRNMSIKEAAFSCGFNDEKYYMRVFRKIEGMTPGQYRSAIGVK